VHVSTKIIFGIELLSVSVSVGHQNNFRLIAVDTYIAYMANVKIVESKLDIFQAPQTHALAHAVESSFVAERGSLAWQFALIYGDVDELRQRRVARGNCAVLEHNSRFIYYLVTKSNLYEASTYDDVQAALICMREHMVSFLWLVNKVFEMGWGFPRKKQVTFPPKSNRTSTLGKLVSWPLPSSIYS